MLSGTPPDTYLREAHGQLYDRHYYIKLGHNLMGDLIFEISIFVVFLHQQRHLDYSTFTFLDPSNNSRIQIFYLQPKIHIPGVPGRPIISGCNSPTINLSKYIDYYLKLVVRQIPSYIQDTTHKIKDIAGDIPCNSILVTFDVKLFCTNILLDEGINACIRALQSFYGSNLPLSVKHLKDTIFNF